MPQHLGLSVCSGAGWKVTPGVQIRPGSKVIDLRRCDRRWEVDLADGSTVPAAVVIDASGPRSSDHNPPRSMCGVVGAPRRDAGARAKRRSRTGSAGCVPIPRGRAWGCRVRCRPGCSPWRPGPRSHRGCPGWPAARPSPGFTTRIHVILLPIGFSSQDPGRGGTHLSPQDRP